MSKTRTATASIIPAVDALAVPESHSAEGGWLQRLGKRLFLRALSKIQLGELTVVVPATGEQHVFGRRTAGCDLHATLEVLHPQTFADAAFGGTVGGGEAYIRGFWRADDLTALVRMFVANREAMESFEGAAACVSDPLRRVLHWFNRNSMDGSRRNIAAHYDLGNDLFALFLDETMLYSCAVFEREDASLHEAQLAKLDRICRRLRLSPGDHLLEIGTGWGGLALHAAQQYGCRVTTTTISREQHDWAQQKFAAAGLLQSGQVTLLLEDYRNLTGTYDKLVSVEMIEAVGAQYLDTYLARCSSLLRPDGAMLLQAITIQDQVYEQALKSVDFIQRFIFPGSFIPSVTAIVGSLRRATDMKVFHLEDIGPHYATTLRKWRENFLARLAQVRQLGYPDSFIRMWDFYLCYCEGGFLERQIGDVQMLLTKPRCRLPAPA
ncbi:MAG: cyclopropane-fatty-acyl-phospholipid synthase family protein [Gammaproteobacteria bacterium]|nr:cyclopropane-fatty-acyl-phospholipid synthase family protein [Gammaproteobacteria bacterium]MDH4310494.1 cyclopropane-fatty-acyl-phospholipid synthase family protein [Gammaproteobacteria bacterium]